MFAPHPYDCVEHPDEDLGVRQEEREKRSELEAHPCVCLGMLEVFGPHPYERGAMPDAKGEAPSVARTAAHAWAAMRRSNDGMPCAKVGILHPFLAMRHPFLAMPRPFLAMLRPFLATLHAFAATRREGEDASREESPGHCASRGTGSERVGSSSERETTRPIYVGMPRE